MEQEPEKLELLWEAPPKPVKPHKGWKWEVLLRPVKAAPGSPARIRTHLNEAAGRAEVRRIRDRLDKVAPLDKWEFNVFEINDRSGKWGTWATYHGQMTANERMEFVLKREARSKLIREKLELKKLKAQIEGSLFEDLTHPDMSRR